MMRDVVRTIALAGLLASCIPKGARRSTGPTSHGSSSGTQVYRTTATGAPVSGPSTGASANDAAGKGKPRNELLRAGLITLGVSYAATVVIGQTIQATLIGDFETAVGAKETIARLWLPVVGPWAALVYNEGTVRSNCNDIAGNPPWEYYDCSLMDASSVAVAVGALAQTTGLVLTFIALQRPPKPVKHEQRRVVITPHGNAGGGAGVVVSGQF